MERAQKNHIYQGRSFSHQDCGGHVNSIWHTWHCQKCLRSWHGDRIKRMTEEAFSDTFWVLPIAVAGEHALVWKLDKVTGMQHAGLVPAMDAGKYEKVKI